MESFSDEAESDGSQDDEEIFTQNGEGDEVKVDGGAKSAVGSKMKNSDGPPANYQNGEMYPRLGASPELDKTR